MASTKRLRIFAGPNGSGKSTFINQIKLKPPGKNFNLGYYVNADDIERVLKSNLQLNFNDYGIQVNNRILRSYFQQSTFAPVKLNLPNLYQKFLVFNQILVIDPTLEINSYIAADLAEFIRLQLLKHGHSFSFETVMSDKQKLNFLKKAQKAGYRIYLYYFSTEDPRINISRIRIRVKQDGHNVNPKKVKERYFKSLQNLKSALKISNRAYLFDNSQSISRLISEITDGKHVHVFDTRSLPTWFMKYVVN